MELVGVAAEALGTKRLSRNTSGMEPGRTLALLPADIKPRSGGPVLTPHDLGQEAGQPSDVARIDAGELHRASRTREDGKLQIADLV